MENYPGMPFSITPNPTTASERYAYQMYTSNNLYYIISNGGVELTQEQNKFLFEIRDKIVGKDYISRVENYNTATLSREAIHTLITEISDYISRHQLKIIANKQQYCHEELL